MHYVRKFRLNGKYIKTKQNQKFEAKFFKLFLVLHPVGKQTFKVNISAKLRIHDIFYISLLKQNIIKKGKDNKLLDWKQKLDTKKDKKYKFKAIKDSTINTKVVEN